MQKVRVKQRKAPAATSLPKEAGFFVDTHGASSDDGHSDNAGSEVEPMPKDETEEKLERLLFGDTAGFHDALREHDVEGMELVLRDSGSEDGKGDGEEEEGGLEGVDDADVRLILFFRVELRSIEIFADMVFF